MNQQAQAAQVEERVFTPAELKTFTAKYDKFLKAQAEVNEFVSFLKDQHGVDDAGGWQLGERGFARRVSPAQTPPADEAADKDAVGVVDEVTALPPQG